MALPAPPAQGLSAMGQAGLQQAPMQGMAKAPGVMTQPMAPPTAVSQIVPPQMQQLQAQLAQMAQANSAMAPGQMQQIMGMMGPGRPMMPGASLGSLMQPQMTAGAQMPQGMPGGMPGMGMPQMSAMPGMPGMGAMRR